MFAEQGDRAQTRAGARVYHPLVDRLFSQPGSSPGSWRRRAATAAGAALALAALLARPAGGALLRVPGEYATIQYALIVAAAGDTVLVAPHTCYETIVWPDKPSLCLLSEAGPEATTIDGLHAGPVIRFSTALDSTTVVRGFTITNGQADLGGGIRCENASPLIVGNHFVANVAIGYGGGFYCAEGSCAPILRDNRFIDNAVLSGSGGGVCAHFGAFPIVTGNEFRGNSADLFYGGGVHCEEAAGHGSRIVIAGNDFFENSARGGGAISLFNPFALAPEIRGNRIVGNVAQSGGGGVMLYWTLAAMTDNVIRDNRSDGYGGGVHLVNSHTVRLWACDLSDNRAASGGGISFIAWCHGPEVIDCTISGNEADDGGGVYVYYYCTPVLRGNRIVGNTASGIGGAMHCRDLSAPELEGNLVAGNRAALAGGLSFVHSAPEIRRCTLIDNGDIGLRFSDGWPEHAPRVHENDLSGHEAYGIENADPAVVVEAESNWWGDPSGPYHPLLNPGGAGDRVSDHVSFEPWLLEPMGAAEVPAPGGPAVHGRLPALTCRPNPSRGPATISLAPGAAGAAAERSGARVTILDAAGRALRVLPLRPRAEGGAELTWLGDDRSGAPVPAGVYYLRLEGGSVSGAVKVVRID